MNHAALNQYKTVGLQGGMMDATPHQMITMLLDGFIDRVAAAKGAIARGEVGRKGELIGSAIAIIDGLRASLDFERGGEISANLASLYDYIERRLVQAGADSDATILDEVTTLISEVKSGWESIPDNLRKV